MEQKTALGSAASNQYFSVCERAPLCSACTHGLWRQVGFPMLDFRWGRLAAAAAASQTEPRTAATGEVRLAAQCCHCRGELDQEHYAPEHPLPIIPGRPVGWITCARCRLTYSHGDNGARIQHHSCPSQNRGGNRSRNIQKLNDRSGSNPHDLVRLQRTMFLRVPLAHNISGRRIQTTISESHRLSTHIGTVVARVS